MIKLTFDSKNQKDKMDLMKAFHEALAGSPGYINSEIAILEPNGRNSNDFMLVIGNEGVGEDCDILIQNSAISIWDGEVDALNPKIRFEQFDELTRTMLDGPYKKSLILNNTASGIYICPGQIDIVLTLYKNDITYCMMDDIVKEFGPAVNYTEAPDGYFDMNPQA